MPRLCHIRKFAVIAALALTAACAPRAPQEGRLATRGTFDEVPAARWDHRPEGEVWTLRALEALERDGDALVEMVPEDIATFCPAYAENGPEERRAFWVGLMSALAKHESTWRPEASGGGGRWLGLLQIAPATAEAYGCALRSRRDLFDGATNLACAVRIMARQVARHGVIAGEPGEWGGVAADWAPMRHAAKRDEMAAWTRAQSYCEPDAPRVAALNPLARLLGRE